MSAWILAVWLLLSPLPGVSALPNGSELKLVSADLRTIYVSYRVEDRKLVASAPRLPLGGVREVRLWLQVGGKVSTFPGMVAGTDVRLQIDNEPVSLNELLIKIYRLTLPDGKFLPDVR